LEDEEDEKIARIFLIQMENCVESNEFGRWKMISIGDIIKLLELFEVENKKEALLKVIKLIKHFRGK
jgi:hypothetical protein